jgi:Flp pilus assembly protein TadD
MIKLLESRRFKDANYFAEKLSRKNPLSGPAYFVSAAYYESTRNLDEANRYILEAIRIDKYNITYLNAATLISLKRNDLDAANRYLKKSKEVKSDQKAIEILSDLIAKASS